MTLQTQPFDVAHYLINEGTISAYLTDALQGGDPLDIAQALGDVVRARGGIDQMSEETGIPATELERALSGRESPDFSVVLIVLRVLRVKLIASAKSAESVAA